MAESKQRAEEFEINPDGADLDGTAEIERQQSGGETAVAASQPTTVPVTDEREKQEREARDKAR